MRGIMARHQQSRQGGYNWVEDRERATTAGEERRQAKIQTRVQQSRAGQDEADLKRNFVDPP